MPSNVTPKIKRFADDELVVYNGLQFQPAQLPDGVDPKGLPTLREYLDSKRVGGKQAVKSANKSATAE